LLRIGIRATLRVADEILVHSRERLTERLPMLDFALVALRRALGLPRGVAFGLFALGRTVGWIAHALEQRERPAERDPSARRLCCATSGWRWSGCVGKGHARWLCPAIAGQICSRSNQAVALN
jgi:hypothetical protein